MTPGLLRRTTMGDSRDDVLRELIRLVERYQLALEGTGAGYWDWNVKTGEVVFGELWSTMLGYRPEDIEPHVSSWERLVHPDDLEPVLFVVDAHLRGETESYRTEHRMLAADGTWRWIIDRGKVVERDAEGKAIRAVGTHVDITERVMSEQALRQAERRNALSIELSTDAITLVGENGVIYANPAALALLGASTLDELRDGPYLGRIHPDDRALVDRHARRLFETGRSSGPIEIRMLRLDGSEVPVEADAFLIPLGSETVQQVVTRDITDRKRSAEKIARQQEQVETLAAALLKSGDVERRRVAMGLHEGVAQSLAAVKIHAKRLASLGGPDATSDIERMTAALDDAITGLRVITAELSPPVFHQFGLQAALEWLADDVRARWGLECEVLVDEAATRLKNDAAMLLFRSARELLTNVHKHADVAQAAVSSFSEGGYLCLRVRDEGSGFSAERALGPDSRGYGLTGIVQEAEFAGGDVLVDSAVGEGSTVLVRVPVDVVWSLRRHG